MLDSQTRITDDKKQTKEYIEKKKCQIVEETMKSEKTAMHEMVGHFTDKIDLVH